MWVSDVWGEIWETKSQDFVTTGGGILEEEEEWVENNLPHNRKKKDSPGTAYYSSSPPPVIILAHFLMSILLLPAIGASATIVSHCIGIQWFMNTCHITNVDLSSHLFLRELLSPRRERVFQCILVTGSITIVILSKGIHDDLFVIRALCPVSEYREEHREVYGSRCFLYHWLQLFLSAQSSCTMCVSESLLRNKRMKRRRRWAQESGICGRRKHSPKESNVCLMSFLLMKPSLSWSIIWKACRRSRSKPMKSHCKDARKGVWVGKRSMSEEIG